MAQLPSQQKETYDIVGQYGDTEINPAMLDQIVDSRASTDQSNGKRRRSSALARAFTVKSNQRKSRGAAQPLHTYACLMLTQPRKLDDQSFFGFHLVCFSLPRITVHFEAYRV